MSISENIERLQSAKQSIRTAIENKGVPVDESLLLNSYALLIDKISTGGQTITFNVIPSLDTQTIEPPTGYTFSSGTVQAIPSEYVNVSQDELTNIITLT